LDYARSTTFSVSLEGITETQAAGIQKSCTTNRYCAHAPGEPRSMGRCTARLPRTTRSKTHNRQCPYPTPRPFYESAVADEVLRNDRGTCATIRVRIRRTAASALRRRRLQCNRDNRIDAAATAPPDNYSCVPLDRSATIPTSCDRRFSSRSPLASHPD
jgi:hypothetical protein